MALFLRYDQTLALVRTYVKYIIAGSADKVAIVTNTIVPKYGTDNKVSGAIAQVLSGIDFDPTLPGIGRLNGISTSVGLGETVRMIGRTTGIATGQVESVETSIILSLEDGQATFNGLIVTTGMSHAGDSGAPVVNTRNELVGMVYGGTERKTIVMPIAPILKAFRVSLVQ